MPVWTDPLMGQVVSLGEAKFASATPGGGGGDGYEVLDDHAFSIGGMLFTAKQAQRTKMTGDNSLGKEVANGYIRKKTDEVKKVLKSMHKARQKYLSEYVDSSGLREEDGAAPRAIRSHATYYAMEATMPDIPLTQVRITGGRGVAWMTREAGLVWKLTLNFSHFDADTLTGKVKGVLEGSDKRG
jgi:hypothetical protein